MPVRRAWAACTWGRCCGTNTQSPTCPSDTTLIEVNKQIEAVLRRTLGTLLAESALAIRFDLPERGKVDQMTISVFLYEIHEDLSLRTAVSRQYDVGTGRLLPGRVPLRCCYLITCWEPPHNDGPAFAGPYNLTATLMNQVIQALASQRSLPGLPEALCEVLPPAEALGSLSNFWQALGNMPRLCVSYRVTVPVPLTDRGEAAPPVTTMEAGTQPKAAIDLVEGVAHQVREALWAAIMQMGFQGENTRAQFDRVAIDVVPLAANDRAVQVTLSGPALQPLYGALLDIAYQWRRESKTITLAPGVTVPTGVRQARSAKRIASIGAESLKGTGMTLGTTLMALNQQIEQALKDYLDPSVQIRFDLPKGGEVDIATVSVFLYHIQEDLQMRSSESRRYDAGSGRFAAGRVHINRVLNALINHRTLPAMEQAYCRVLPPAETLNSLGTFWHALGDQPRLSLGYMVTIPIELTASDDPVVPVTTIAGEWSGSGEEPYRQAERLLWEELCDACASDELSRARLAKVAVRCVPLEPGTDTLKVKIVISGPALTATKGQLEHIAAEWRAGKTVHLADGVTVAVQQVDTQGLVEVKETEQ
ncbi:hypothetical protein DFQ30_006415 [Apophysomyces sp. BC1015]|nr:hypothetical protein DFQ30_006415 [Apophysomyces sp. BC1015]